MQLTGIEIIDRKILTNVDEASAVQQQGVDIRLDRVFKILPGKPGFIPKSGKTQLPGSMEVPTDSTGVFFLEPGYYEVIFLEGCRIPNDLVINNIKSRSSLVRCGAHIQCGQFDAGFKTEQMGCFLKVEVPIKIERGARIAQVQVFETREVVTEHMYNGQWQGDNQRTV